MKSETIKEMLKLSYDANTTYLLIIPLVFLGGKVFNKWISYSDTLFIALLTATMLLPVVATNYCYREDRSLFEKGVFIFFSLCSLVILCYYARFSGQPAMDNFVMWMGCGLIYILCLFAIVFTTIYDHKYKQLSQSATASVKIGKRPLEWVSLLFVIGAIVLINIWPN